MLLLLVLILLLWMAGFSLNLAGPLIHLLLVAAVIVVIVQLVTGRRAP
jgi:hypothetical protein